MAAETATPIFSGPGVVTLLALVIALAVYLRNVFAYTQDSIESVLLDEKKHVYPKPDRHREKLELLTKTNNYIEAITPYMFMFCGVIAARLVAATFVLSCAHGNDITFDYCKYSHFVYSRLRGVDYLISIVLFVLILGMWAAHHFLKNEEIKLRYGIFADFSRREHDEDTRKHLQDTREHRDRVANVVRLCALPSITFITIALFFDRVIAFGGSVTVAMMVVVIWVFRVFPPSESQPSKQQAELEAFRNRHAARLSAAGVGAKRPKDKPSIRPSGRGLGGGR
jgi:hypothetical protein